MIFVPAVVDSTGRPSRRSGHHIVGRMINEQGCIVFCRCGGAFYGAPQPPEDETGMRWADDRWIEHHGIEQEVPAMNPDWPDYVNKITAQPRWKIAVRNRVDAIRGATRIVLRHPTCGAANRGMRCDRPPGHEGNHQHRRGFVSRRSWLGGVIHRYAARVEDQEQP